MAANRFFNDNPYFTEKYSPWRKYCIYDDIPRNFHEFRFVSFAKMRLIVSDMLLLLGFKHEYLGFGYLCTIIEHYVLYPDYSYQKALKQIWYYLGVRPTFIEACIQESLDRNTEFMNRLKNLLNNSVLPQTYSNIEDAVMLIGAVYLTYYNQIPRIAINKDREKI